MNNTMDKMEKMELDAAELEQVSGAGWLCFGDGFGGRHKQYQNEICFIHGIILPNDYNGWDTH